METTLASLFSFKRFTRPASLWEVESMETSKLLRLRCLPPYPLPSGKWNQWKLELDCFLFKRSKNPLPSGKWNQWKLPLPLPDGRGGGLTRFPLGSGLPGDKVVKQLV
ncbi:hypothetical protein CRC_00327 [Cylindrospermopsis raciborskii CS-505]|nr:hypothetical protein CRC_00327 [Cylindrospermopsis raciborskii CS-505]